MTALSPLDGTGHPLTASLPIVTIVDESAARHRADTYVDDSTVPAWVQFAAALIAVTVAWFAGIVRDPYGTPLLLLIAVLIAAAAFTSDIDAAIRTRAAEREAAE